MYKTDKIWLEAKKIAREGGFSDDWIKVIDLYNLSGGEHVKIYTALNETKYRIIGLTDTGEVILTDRANNVVIEAYQPVFESQKIFFYAEETKMERLQLPEQNKCLEREWVNIPV